MIQSYSDIITNSSSEIFLQIKGNQIEEAAKVLTPIFEPFNILVPDFDKKSNWEDEGYYEEPDNSINFWREYTSSDDGVADYMAALLTHVLKDLDVEILTEDIDQ